MSRLLDMLARGGRPVIGMVQLPPLAGGANYGGAPVGEVLEAALEEARVLADNGIDGLMVQNLGDIPVAHAATAAQVAWMTRATVEIGRIAACPVGLNMLENDVDAMFAVASAAGADFVRIKVFVGAMVTPFGLEQGRAHAAARARRGCGGGDIAILADVHDRTGTPLATSGFEEDLDFALRLGGADAVVVTGKSHAATLDMAARARAAHPAAHVLLGGGVTAENFEETMENASGAIVSSSMKDSGSAVGRFVPERVEAFMAAARAARAAA
ncbi:hypothetical protein OG2516_12934 [Oceanicola granulosus HTCC2516]|uniref:Photosystem I assembly BtpA n=1 Tax=Oceanicola granulosus (strain ATCC BAA-861 / DSM 15982 / KCTC 12143 / HTCC2516) TaxID=314256 RepID=Q2CH81_OCEGH|nr:BtpA/SgcQ family protein [Oceanicola granulosus]EAR51930.1 hypothetical protein OG2516_12934 [Oceanicola granulosus HTCC2516]